MTPTASIEIYTWSSCPYCLRAKALLTSKGAAFEEHCVDGDEEARRAMSKRAGGRTSVPQIFIDGRHVGGCDDLHALDAAGKLDPLLSRAAG
jgi:glutaredoxin 3